MSMIEDDDKYISLHSHSNQPDESGNNAVRMVLKLMDRVDELEKKIKSIETNLETIMSKHMDKEKII